jgi:hypothetical protein
MSLQEKNTSAIESTRGGADELFVCSVVDASS